MLIYPYKLSIEIYPTLKDKERQWAVVIIELVRKRGVEERDIELYR